MPSMKRDSTLRVEPAGALMQVIGTEGARVDILGTKDVTTLGTAEEWTKIKLVEADDAPEGWVLSDRVDAAGLQPTGPIDEVKFTRQCWLEALIADVTPHYVVAVAQLRSGRSQGEVAGEIGPFRFTQAEWDAYRAEPELGLTDYGPFDVFDWRMQTVMFCTLTAELETDLTDRLGGPPSVSQLYLAQIVGASAGDALIKTPAKRVDAALAAVPDAELPAGGMTRDQLVARFPGLLGTPAQPVSGADALKAITAAMQPILDATRQVVEGVGTEYLGLIPHDGEVDKADDPGPAKPPPPVKVPKLPKGSGPTIVPGAGGILGELIAKHEGGSAGYGAFNRGIAGVGGRMDFSKVTIQQLTALQSLKDKSKRLFAVGKYQIIPVTMRECVSSLRIDRSLTYDPAIQEFMFRNFLIAIKRPAVKRFIIGAGATLFQAQMALAFEFASVARPDTGRSNYGGVGGNKASITAQQTKDALNGEAARYQQILAQGSSADDAWNALSPGFT